ncbi:MAG: hypothetical protein ACOYM2_17470 [Rectinemataceae bacterium]
MPARNKMPVSVLILVLALAAPAATFAWSNHALLAAISLAEEGWGTRMVIVEPLDDFLSSAKAGVATALTAAEAKAKSDYKGYKPLPAALAFNPATEGEALRASFVGAIRVNPGMPFPDFLQVPVNEASERPGLASDASVFKELKVPNSPLRALETGEEVEALKVVETAAEEPDYGMDIGLYEDNNTDYGKAYGFGVQPFGNPALFYGSQAPFHMSFDNEDGIIHMLATFTTESNVGYRLDLYSALSRAAFAAGHEYWGWRFAGWALHYVQDITMPYHATVMPSKDTFGLILLNGLGSKADKDAAVTLLSNRHSILEDYQGAAFLAWAGDHRASQLYAALKPGALSYPVAPLEHSGKAWALAILGKASRARGIETDKAIVAAFPANYVSDPSFDFGKWQADTGYAYDPHAELLAVDSMKAQAFEAVLAKSLAATGAGARGFMASFSAAGTSAIK